MTDVTRLALAPLLLRRAGAVAAVGAVLAMALGLARLAADIDDEARAADALAAAGATLIEAAGQPEAQARQTLARLQAQGTPPGAATRHLRLRVEDAQGRVLLDTLPGGEPPTEAGPSVLLTRPDGAAPWRVRWLPTPLDERREAWTNFIEFLLLLLGTLAAVLLVMRRQVARALAPLGRLVDGIGGLERGDLQALREPPAGGTREVHTLGAALSHLAGELDAAEQRRRQLALQLASLREQERHHLGRELHDELGARLTALHVDAAWLVRRLAELDLAEPAAVADGMRQQAVALQQDLRSLLVRLQPFGEASDEAQPAAAVAALLGSLASGWQAPERGLTVTWRLRRRDGPDAAWQDGWTTRQDAALPAAVALALYRLSQEALTNVARHAQASRAEVAVDLEGRAAPGAPLRIVWSVEDDGVGLPAGAAAGRGSGLAGMRERVWALGGRFVESAATAHGHGTRLEAVIPTQWVAPTEAGRGTA